MKHRTFQHYAAPATPNAGRCLQVPRLPRERKVDVPKCHACQVKGRRMLPSATPATQSAAASPATTGDQGACHAKRMSMSPSATPAKWKEGGCCLVPRLPRKVPRRHRRPPATTGDHRRPRSLPRQTHVDVSKCHACHVKRRWMAPSATSATQSAAASPATNGGQARHQVQLVPRLPRQTQVDASKCHDCHVKGQWMSPSATPATWKEGGCHHVCARWCVTKLCVCDKVVCERWCVTKLCVKHGGWSCV